MTVRLDPLPAGVRTLANYAPDWGPFAVLPPNERPKGPRAMTSREGIGDRLRAAAFAEIQAYYGFLWAAEKFDDAPEALRVNWRGLALAEERHLNWLLNRMKELGIAVDERGVSDWLWTSLVKCANAREFAVYIANSEERGRLAGARFCEAMMAVDPTTAKIFGKIAEEEVEHIRLATKFYPDAAVVSPVL
ncbi:MAG: DUF455 family protein [Bdellovibrionales bacterium]|nr:DUF455 family protein [Bdellovibrionales bacterium]